MTRPSRVSPDRILAAAAVEFAERGYAGARVDRIARRARVNKAMLYYHFKSKEGLYRTLLRQTFSRAGERLRSIAASDAGPAEQLERAIAAVAALVRDHAFFPAVMLREVAEGGAHLDRETLTALATVPAAVAGIVSRGISSGAFRHVHPLAAYFSIVVPIVVYLAATPIRKELAEQHLLSPAPPTPEEFVSHMQQVARRALSTEAPRRARPV